MSPVFGISPLNPPTTKAAHLPTTRSTTAEGDGHSLVGSSAVKAPENHTKQKDLYYYSNVQKKKRVLKTISSARAMSKLCLC